MAINKTEDFLESLIVKTGDHVLHVLWVCVSTYLSTNITSKKTGILNCSENYSKIQQLLTLFIFSQFLKAKYKTGY